MFLIIMLVCAFLLTTPAWADTASPTQTLERWVIGGGGGHAQSADGHYTLNATVGQPVAGIASADVCSGFWCGLGGQYSVYLPLVLK
jgi:hypothetical protein